MFFIVKRVKGLHRCYRDFFTQLLVCLLFLEAASMVSAADINNKVDIPAESDDFQGTLYLVGGGADTTLERFAELAGGEKGLVAILPHAAPVSEASEYADAVANLLRSYGVKDFVTIMPGTKGVLPQGVTAVWFTGGDQNRLMRQMDQDKDLLIAVRKFLKSDKGLVGGTSAGAAAAAMHMIAGGVVKGRTNTLRVSASGGLAFLRKKIIDTHVWEQGRTDRLDVALAMYEDVEGIGLDEDTAIEIKGGKATVHGQGYARLYKRSADFQFKLVDPDSKVVSPTSVRNVIHSIIPTGEQFDL